MDDDQQFCLRWNNHQSTLISVFDTLLENQTLVDCTLAAEGKFLKAHKVVLSACSPYFATLLQEQYDKHPIFILKDVKFQELRAMMDYMYRGEVNISQDQLAALLKAAESLQIKGLSDNRSTGNINPAPKLDGAHQQHRNLNVGANVGIKIGGGYTLEQTKRTRLGPNALDVQEMSGSREGSSSPSRRRKKVRRRSIEASLADIQHDNSNSSLQQQSNVVISAPGISNVNPISAAASVLAAAQLPSGATPGTVVGTSQTVASSSSSAAAAAAAAVAAANIAPGLVAAATQQMLTNVTKKTESVKGASASSEAMNTEDLATGVSVDEQEQQQTASKVDKHNHKYKATSGKDTSDIVEPKSEYDDDGNEGTVEDLTLDEEDMGIDDLDQNAGTSHVGEGSSQGYAPWQHERSQDDLLMTQQDAQQRDPQDLSITRIAGLTWTEWNARLAMPLVTQLSEGAQPLIFPTDLSINSLDKHNLETTTRATTSASAQRKSSPPPSVKLEKSQNGSGSSTPIKSTRSLSSCAAEINDKVTKLKNLNEEEATALMLKSAADKLNCGNVSDTSEENNGVSCVAAAAADFSLCNINILSSISAMNSLIGAGGNAGLGMSNRSSTGSVELPAGSGTGSFSSGHPCPECGRVYKLKSSLRNHQKWECGKEPQFQCPFCVYRAKQKMHIGRHMERMHKEKFIKLEDLKSFTPSTATGGGVAGGMGSGSSVTDDSGAASVATGLQQHFAN